MGEEGREEGVYEKVKVEYAMDGVRCAPQLLFPLHSLAAVEQDFSFSATLLTFQPGEERLCAHANITDDSLGELDEEFHVCLERVDVFTVIGQPNTTITIVDNDSECGGCIAMAQCTYYIYVLLPCAEFNEQDVQVHALERSSFSLLSTFTFSCGGEFRGASDHH